MTVEATMLPPWMVVPPALVLVVAIGAHMAGMRGRDMPPSRRRIRTANGVLMLLTVPLTAFAFCAVSPADPRFFVLTWFAVVVMVGLVVAMAMADILNNLWLAHRHAQDLRAHLRAVQRALLEHTKRAHAQPLANPAPPIDTSRP
jgi:hypothetical protein